MSVTETFGETSKLLFSNWFFSTLRQISFMHLQPPTLRSAVHPFLLLVTTCGNNELPVWSDVANQQATVLHKQIPIQPSSPTIAATREHGLVASILLENTSHLVNVD